MGIPCEGTGINCYGMRQINMSHGQPSGSAFGSTRLSTKSSAKKNSFLRKHRFSLPKSFNRFFSRLCMTLHFINFNTRFFCREGRGRSSSRRTRNTSRFSAISDSSAGSQPGQNYARSDCNHSTCPLRDIWAAFAWAQPASLTTFLGTIW